MAEDKSFIEVQFPVSKVSKESYKERKANLGQTLTGIGKWWGRKPLVLVRAAVLGLLMPASDNPQKDMEIFLKIMTMDKNGLKIRKNKSITAADAFEVMTPRERGIYFDINNSIRWKIGMSDLEKNEAIKKAWNRFTYDKKLTYCIRPEEVENIAIDEWKAINEHLGTKATNLQELTEELGIIKFGRKAVVGDCFCGGGSVPFEAARMGNDVFASDLNPIAGLLTWADLNIIGSSDEDIKELNVYQKQIYDEVYDEVSRLGIETNESSDRAYYYLYCCETICPECGYKVPLSPSWIIGKGTKTVAILKDNNIDGFDMEIKSFASAKELTNAEELKTIRSGNMYCPHCTRSVPISALRKDTSEGYGLRLWEKNQFIPEELDTFQDRLYCIKYEHEFIDDKGNLKSIKYYVKPSDADLEREKKVIDLLSERFTDWQEKGYIPSGEIEEGEKTNELMRTRGWKYWHQLFNPRQLLIHGLFMQKVDQLSNGKKELVFGITEVNKCTNWNSKLSQWVSDGSMEQGAQTFYNQALNTFFNGLSRTTSSLKTTWFYKMKNAKINSKTAIHLADARNINSKIDMWITDPPYADAVNYHELSEFFLAWDKKLLKKAFPEWYTDSKRVLAVRGRDETFNSSMIEIYTNLTNHMPYNGMQIIMFTHQDVSVWADLALIVWSAGLQVTAAWNIATETDASGLKDGNYVKGTVILVLRKQIGSETAYLDELYPDIEEEVKRQIDSMHSLDDKEEPNFSDADYILAAYAAALKVLTSVKHIEDIDVQYELSRERKKGELSPIAKLIESATKIAYDQLIPTEFDNFIWRSLVPDERLYIKGLELEKNNIYQVSAYQELARGFGVANYKDLMENTRANTARFKTGSEWANRNIEGDGIFSSSLLRHVLMATYIATKEENNVLAGKNWLRNEVEDYWNKRERICEFLKYIAAFELIENMKHWHKEAAVANILKELVANDGI